MSIGATDLCSVDVPLVKPEEVGGGLGSVVHYLKAAGAHMFQIPVTTYFHELGYFPWTIKLNSIIKLNVFSDIKLNLIKLNEIIYDFYFVISCN
jgi:hypothetical protein